MLDWGGSVVNRFGYERGVANIYVIDRRGRILKHVAGPVNDIAELELFQAIDRAITNSPSRMIVSREPRQQPGRQSALAGGTSRNSLDQPFGKAFSSGGAAEQGADDHAAVAILSANVRVGDDAGLEIVGVFPGEIKRSGKRAGDVTRGTKPSADHDVVRIARPFLRLVSGEPVVRPRDDRLAQIRAGADVTKDSCQCIAGFHGFRRAMGQRNVFANRAAGAPRVVSEKRTKDADMSKSADAVVAATALAGCSAASVVGKEFPVTLLDVGIPMPARGGHELNVTLEIIVRVVASARHERINKHFCKLEIQRVLTRLEELVIMDPFSPPVFGLPVKDFAAGVESRVTGAPEYAVGMRVSWRDVVADNTVGAAQRRPVVVPMDGHRKGVSNEGAPSDAGAPVLEVRDA